MPSEIWRNYVSEILNGGFVWTKRDLSRFHDRGQTIAVPWELWDSQPPVGTNLRQPSRYLKLVGGPNLLEHAMYVFV